jgi:L-amino acid N-acyltransferase YncA
MGITSDASGNGSPASIRLSTERDAEQIAATYAPNVTDTVISFEFELPSADEIRRRIEVTLERYPWLVCEHQGRLLGYSYAGTHGSRLAYQWSVDVSITVLPQRASYVSFNSCHRSLRRSVLSS